MKYFLFFLAIFSFCLNVFGRISPSFSLEYSAWNATHISVVTEGGEIDGLLRILEPIKGDFGFGETISIPQLAEFKTEDSRLIYDDWDVFRNSGNRVSGARMFLFLRKTEDSANEWRSAGLFSNDSEFGRIRYSVMWIEDGKAFAFAQMMDPGPTLLIDFNQTEDEVKTKTYELIQMRQSFDSAFELRDPGKLFKALKPFVVSDRGFVSYAVFTELEERGSSSLPVLRLIINDESSLIAHDRAAASFGKIGGVGVGGELTELLKSEIDFWQRVSPLQIRGWLDANDNSDTEKLNRHFSKTLQIIYQLRLMRFKPAEKVVTELRDFWLSSPQLRANVQMTDDCNAFLAEITAGRNQD